MKKRLSRAFDILEKAMPDPKRTKELRQIHERAEIKKQVLRNEIVNRTGMPQKKKAATALG
jgi:hypothetical protein